MKWEVRNRPLDINVLRGHAICISNHHLIAERESKLKGAGRESAGEGDRGGEGGKV